MQQESDVSVDVAILLVLGIFSLVLGARIFSTSSWPPQSAYGLFIVVSATHSLTLGKTPFGDLRRSWSLITLSFLVAAYGMYVAWVPANPDFVRRVVGAILFIGGSVRLVGLFVDRAAARNWLSIGGVLISLTIACSIVYALTAILGALTLLGILAPTTTAILLLLFTMSLFYVAHCLEQVDRLYPMDEGRETATGDFGWVRQATLSNSQAFSFLMGTFFLCLGFLLSLVSVGLLPFSPDGQIATILTVVAVQIMSTRDARHPDAKQSGSVLIIGVVLAGLGAVSATFPGALTGVLSALFAIANLISGAIGLAAGFRSGAEAERSVVASELRRVHAIQTVTSFLMLLLGLSFLAKIVWPSVFGHPLLSLAAAGILMVTGFLYFARTVLLMRVERHQSRRVAEAQLAQA
ncbi:hypothetical protein WOC76_15700 [Methylocystis sp. IM3]|uniref:hypothetical protein n=1 Tax=unclassified Methylocystis TaxID=2625913 RepID=UPI00311924DA